MEKLREFHVHIFYPTRDVFFITKSLDLNLVLAMIKEPSCRIQVENSEGEQIISINLTTAIYYTILEKKEKVPHFYDENFDSRED